MQQKEAYDLILFTSLSSYLDSIHCALSGSLLDYSKYVLVLELASPFQSFFGDTPSHTTSESGSCLGEIPPLLLPKTLPTSW